MDERGGEFPDANPRPREFGSARGLIHMTDDFDEPAFCEAALADWNREEEDAAWAHLQQPSEGVVTPMLEQAIRAARALPEEDQDALAAAMLEWIDDERRSSVSLAATVANVLIAAKTRKATFALQRDAAALRFAEERAARLRLQATEAERLRIECLLLRTSIETAMLEEWQEARDAIPAAGDRFRGAFGQFLSQWADTKGDIPRGDAILIRAVRHEIHIPVNSVIAGLTLLGRANTRSSAQGHLPRVFRDLDRASEILDRFFSLITDTKMKAAPFEVSEELSFLPLRER